MLTEYIHPIGYELDIYSLISGVVSDSFIYKLTPLFFKNSILLSIFYIFFS